MEIQDGKLIGGKQKGLLDDYEALIGKLEEDIQFWAALTLHSVNTTGHSHFVLFGV